MAKEEKVILESSEGEKIEFYVLEQTRIGGYDYLLVTEEATGDGDAIILKDVSDPTDQMASYEFVEDDEELAAIGEIFADMLDDVDII